jgi:DNA-binding IscR family transcriptional regulator
LLEVLTALGGPLLDPDHCNRFTGQLDTCVHVDGCSVHGVLDSLAMFISDLLGKTTLEDLIQKAARDQSHADSVISADTLLTSAPKVNDAEIDKNVHDYKQPL